MKGKILNIHPFWTPREHLLVVVESKKGLITYFRLERGQEINFTCDEKDRVYKIHKLGVTNCDGPIQGMVDATIRS